MDLTLPSAEDHCQIQILIKPLGQLHTPFFNKVLHKLARVEITESKSKHFFC